ncbi:putative U3 small nucleolar RNA-associated protein 7 [Mucor velutinosus]|uniref:U3 small nucleolar RNA-associated protein 7 n=1 Tax=Mucor velutinosus TaxID=708070 RepID=A0AAN7DCV2_9FUNG|nr:putative U3 small nucleolar RNA-associated protein 7 [Mucor velutinosus]
MRNPKDKIPEKDILKKRITTTTTTPSSVKKSASGTSLLPKPTARNTATDKLQRTVEEANNNADQPMQEDQHSTPSVNDDPAPSAAALDNTGAPLVSQMSFSPSANTPEWVFHFQREFRAHEQRIASLEYAMAEIDRLKSELDATKTELASANAQVASLQK